MSTLSTSRILLVDTGKEWGGGTNSMIELLKRIDRSRFEVTALFYHDYSKGNGSRLSAELAKIGIPLRVLPPVASPLWEKPVKEFARVLCIGNRSWSRRLIYAIERHTRIKPMAHHIAEVIKVGNFDLLYLNNQPRSNVEGYLASIAAKVPVVQHCRVKPVVWSELAELVNACNASVMCVSEGSREILLAGGVAVSRCFVVYNGIDCEQALPDMAYARAHLAIPKDAFVIGTVGRLVPMKRTGDLIVAVAHIASRFPDRKIWLLIAGDGPEAERLADLTKSVGMWDRTVFTGFHPEPLQAVATMDVFALTSDSEGFPRSILEAMLSVRPVVASRVNGSRELVLHRETGFLYPCGDIPALEEALSALVSDASLRQRLGQAGLRRVREYFSIERYVAGVERVLADKLEARH